MRRVLLVSQSQDGSYINILHHSLQKLDCKLTVISGKLPADIDATVDKIQSVKYDSTSFRTRFKTWIGYVRDVSQYIRQHIDEFDYYFFTSNPPINQKLVAYIQKKKKRCIYLIWDIYPNTIEIAFGVAAAPIAYLWRKQNARIYRRCDGVITIGEVMKNVLRKDYPSQDIQVIPYHTDTKFIHPITPEDNIFIREHHLYGKKVLMYSGKMGFGHGFNEILESAERLKERLDIQFVLIGFGTAFEDVKNYVREHALSNVLVLPYQPLEMLPYSLSSADVAFITIKPNHDGLFLPSKVYDAMASGSAILCISDGNNDVSRLVDEYQLGENVHPGNAADLAKAITNLVDTPTQLNKCQRNARAVAEQYDIECIVAQYTALFSQMMRG